MTCGSAAAGLHNAAVNTPKIAERSIALGFSYVLLPATVLHASGEPMSAAPVVGAIAACAAATFSLVALVVAGARENRKWRRDASVDLLVSFLDASFASPNRQAYVARLAGQDMGDLRAQAAAAHRSQTTDLTRMRLIAPKSVVVTAEALHIADHEMMDPVLDESRAIPTATEMEDRWRVRDAARLKLIATGRRTLGVRKGPPIGHTNVSFQPQDLPAGPIP
jgi:hypothetical protein